MNQTLRMRWAAAWTAARALNHCRPVDTLVADSRLGKLARSVRITRSKGIRSNMLEQLGEANYPTTARAILDHHNSTGRRNWRRLP